MLTATGRSMPRSRQATACAIASSTTRAVSSGMTPERSASGMNWSGGMKPRTGCRHRTRASTPSGARVARGDLGLVVQLDVVVDEGLAQLAEQPELVGGVVVAVRGVDLDAAAAVLGQYIATSARRSSVVPSTPCAGHIAMPSDRFISRLIVSMEIASAMRPGCGRRPRRPAARRRRRRSPRTRRRRAGRRSRRAGCCAAGAAAKRTSSASPTWWPRVSLMRLKSLRSMSISANGSPSRAWAAKASSARSAGSRGSAGRSARRARPRARARGRAGRCSRAAAAGSSSSGISCQCWPPTTITSGESAEHGERHQRVVEEVLETLPENVWRQASTPPTSTS